MLSKTALADLKRAAQDQTFSVPLGDLISADGIMNDREKMRLRQNPVVGGSDKDFDDGADSMDDDVEIIMI